jgi:hypothetical protein
LNPPIRRTTPCGGDRPGGVPLARPARRAEQDDERRGLQRARAAGTRNFAGAPVSEIYSTGVLSPGAPVNITVWSYVDQLSIAVLTDDETFNDPHEATDALSEAFGELHRAAGLSGRHSALDSMSEHALR